VHYRLKTILGLPRRTILLIAYLILAVEFLIMLLIGAFLREDAFYLSILDPIALILIVIPAIYFMVSDVLKKQQEHLQHEFNELGVAAITFESQEGVMVTDTHNCILRVNHAFTEITGYSNEEIVGKTPVILRSGRQDAEFYRDMWETLKREKFWRGELWNRRKNGEIYIERLSISAVRGENGEITNYIGMFSDLSELKKIEELLRISEIAFENPNGMMVTDANQVILRVNKAFTDISGYSATESVGKTPRFLSSGRHDKQFYADMWATLLQGKTWQGEITNKRKNGKLYSEWLNISPVQEPDGRVTHYVGSFSDITAHKISQKQSIAMYRRNQMLMDTSLDGIHIMDVQGNLLEANDTFCQALGYTYEEIKHLNVSDWDAQFTNDELRTAFNDAIGKTLTIETVHRRKDGELRNVEINAAGCIMDERKYIFASSRDITERTLIQNALQESEEKYRRLFDLSEDPMWIILDSRFVMANPAAAHLLGYEPHEPLTGLHPSELSPEFQPDGIASDKKANALMADALREGYCRFEWIHKKKNGENFPVDVSLTRIPYQGHTALFCIWRDITERKINERQLHDLTAHIQNIREEEKTEIAREIHDDLGNTLTALKVESYLLSSSLSKITHSVPMLERIESMNKLIDSAVFTTRSITTNLRPTILDNLGLIAAIEWQCEEFQQRTNIPCKFTVEGQKDIEDRLNQLHAINLYRISQEALSNVLKHAGATSVKVECDFEHDGEIFILTIADNGRGLPEGYVVRQSSYGMRGMSERVSQLGGQIKFENMTDGGFRVKVALPLSHDHDRKETV